MEFFLWKYKHYPVKIIGSDYCREIQNKYYSKQNIELLLADSTVEKYKRNIIQIKIMKINIQSGKYKYIIIY